MTGDHPIYDGPFGADDLMPTFIELGGRRFTIQFEWKDLTQQYSGVCGWIAITLHEGKEYRGSLSTPIRSVFDLVRQLKHELHCKDETIVTDIPINISRLRWLMNSRSR